MPSSGSGEERTWTIRICPVHGVLPTRLPVPSHEACPAAIETVDVVSRAEREARERFEDTNRRLRDTWVYWFRRAEKAEEALREAQDALIALVERVREIDGKADDFGRLDEIARVEDIVLPRIREALNA